MQISLNLMNELTGIPTFRTTHIPPPPTLPPSSAHPAVGVGGTSSSWEEEEGKGAEEGRGRVSTSSSSSSQPMTRTADPTSRLARSCVRFGIGALRTPFRPRARALVAFLHTRFRP